MLALEIEYLSGTVIASRSPEDARVDWPPQPDRAFSALVASWGARGSSPDERAALEWLESQEPPCIVASEIERRSAVISYVPPNDFKASKSGLDVVPARRSRQARRFPAGRPHDSLVRLIWSADPGEETRGLLDSLARDTSYVGHSTSLTRCRFVDGNFDVSESSQPSRTVYPGRLKELERRFHAGQRPNPGDAFINAQPQQNDVHHGPFTKDWIVLADDGGSAPDIRAFPLVARKVRDALMGAFEKTGSRVPEWLSGHRADGTPSQHPHMAVVPLADFGWNHSEGRLLGCAIVLPREFSIDDISPAIERLIESREDGSRNIELHTPLGCWYLMPTDEPKQSSQRSSRWVRKSRVWTSATPIILDRFPRSNDPEVRSLEVKASIRRSCSHIGLPEPTFISVTDGSAVRGTPPARPAHGAKSWEHWQLPTSLAARPLVHATIGFDAEVSGPMLLGAGRYVGMGLCLPVNARPNE